MQIEGTLGIIGCNSLADEVAYLLNRDRDISQLFIISNPEGSLFQEKVRSPLEDKSCLFQEKDLGLLGHAPGLAVVLWLIPSSLHESPSELYTVLADTIDRLNGYVDSIFVVHGLCGISEHKLTALLRSHAAPINLLTYPDGNLCDDCFGSHIGGKKEYLEFIKKNKFALYVTTGFAAYLKRRHGDQDIVAMVRDIEELNFTLETLGFNRIIKLESDIGDINEFNRTVDMFSRTLNLKVEAYRCGLSVFDASYDQAKKNIERSRIPCTAEHQGSTTSPSLVNEAM